MASNFPSSLDTFTNPSSSDAMDSVSVPHATQHSDLNDAVEALQAKVGADSSGVASSHDYKIAQLEAAAGPGLVFISRTTIGSAVSSVTVSDAFSTDYDSYKIIIQGGASSAEANLQLTLGSTTTGYYYSYWVIAYNSSFSTDSLYSDGLENTSSMAAGHGTSLGLTGLIDLHQPFNSAYTSFNTVSAEFKTGAGNALNAMGWLNNTTSYTAFTVTASTGTMTGGTIDVYGYAKA
jgi:hypothetical protein